MKVAVIGAGVAGLAAGRKLQELGHQVVVFEASSQVGGRTATRRVGAFVFDSGATSIAPRGRPLEAWLHENLGDKLRVIDLPVFVHDGSHGFSGDAFKNATKRYCFDDGVAVLPEALEQGLEVRRDTKVARIESAGEGFAIDQEEFDVVVAAATIPETNAILAESQIRRSLDYVRYRPCISVLLGFEVELRTPYFALVDPEAGQQLQWISLESNKSNGRAPEGCSAIVAQLGAAASQWRADHADEDIVRATVLDLDRIFPEKLGKPVVAEVVRWRYSQPESTATFGVVNRPGARLVVASDGLMGGRVEFAYDMGIEAARHIHEGL